MNKRTKLMRFRFENPQTAGFPTLLDISRSDAGIGFPLIQEASLICPELGLFPGDTMTGTEMKLTVNTGLPTVGFRRINEGAPRSNSTEEERSFQCFNLDHQIGVDQAAVRRSADPGRFLENKAVATLEAIFQKVSKQIWNGTKNDAKGFPGMSEQYKNDADHTVDAAGTTANSKTSVWFVRLARETVCLIGGNDSSINFDEGDWVEETIYDVEGNPIPGLTKWLRGDIGMRLANRNMAIRIKNITTDANKGLTDDLMYQAYQKFTDFGFEPTHIFASSRSISQLRSSRTNTGSNEKGSPVPWPVDWQGIPLIRTSGLIAGETI